MELTLSPLGHTWILDLDGTIVKHNGYKDDGRDTFLDGAMEFLTSIPDDDMVILITSREERYRDQTLTFLSENGIRYDHVIFGAPYGERILMNDAKPSGLVCGISLNVTRDSFPKASIMIDQTI